MALTEEDKLKQIKKKMKELTEQQQEIVDRAYEILAQDEFTAKLTIGAPVPPKRP